MKKFSFVLVILSLFLVMMNSIIFAADGHWVSSELGYQDGSHPTTYTSPAPAYRQGAGTTDALKPTISAGEDTDLYVLFEFDTTGKSVYLVYTTDGSAPTKSNGTSVTCSFSKYSDPNRWWYGTIPSSANTNGTTVNYVFYISDGDLASSWGRVAGEEGTESQYQTSWTEGNNYFSYEVTDVLGATTTKSVSGTGNVLFDDQITAVEIDFSSLTGSGTVTVKRYTDAPSNSDISGNTSNYRWVITKTAGITAFNASVKFKISDIPNNGITNLGSAGTSLFIYSRANVGSGGFSQQTTTEDGTYLIASNISGFSEFAFGSTDNPLPVELSDFFANITPHGVKLTWSTESEINNKGFFVYRNGEKISQLIPGHGTTSEPQIYEYMDANIDAGKTYRYAISDVEEGTNMETRHEEIIVVIDKNYTPGGTSVEAYNLYNNFPNPFNPETTLSFDLPRPTEVTLKIYDLNGKLIKTFYDNERLDAGYHDEIWNGKDDNGDPVDSGIYIYKIESNEFTEAKQMTLLK
jgi:hypothetical protein